MIILMALLTLSAHTQAHANDLKVDDFLGRFKPNPQKCNTRFAPAPLVDIKKEKISGYDYVTIHSYKYYAYIVGIPLDFGIVDINNYSRTNYAIQSKTYETIIQGNALKSTAIYSKPNPKSPSVYMTESSLTLGDKNSVLLEIKSKELISGNSPEPAFCEFIRQ